MKSCPICETAYPNEQATCSLDGADLVPNAELEPGTVIRAKYRIVRTLGHGGMGTVYLAEHLLLGRLRALKFIRGHLSHDPRFVQRFRGEAQTAVELRHPNIVEVVDLDQSEDGTPYIAMEFVDGPDLRAVLQSGPIAIERAIAIARGIVLGLGVAHARGIVHRDLKPENILLAGHHGGAAHPKLADFGIAALNEAAGDIGRAANQILTPEYASPEQWRGMSARQLDGRADLYSLGCVVYEMLTSRRPFDAENADGWMDQHLHCEPPRPSAARPEVAEWPGLDDVVLHLLAKNRDLRTDGAVAAFDALQALKHVSSEGLEATIAMHRSMRFKHPEQPARLERPPKEPAPPHGDEESEEPRTRKPNWLLAGAVAATILVAALIAAGMAVPASTLTEYGRRIGTLHHPGLSMLLYHIACSRGSGEACAQLGLGYNSGSDGAADPEKAAQYFSHACADGYRTGCVEAGQAYEQGQGVPKSDPHAVEFYARACTLSDADGCANLGRMYERGSGIGQDYSRAIALFAQSCESGSASGCEGLARSYRDGHGVTPDAKMAAMLFEKARTLGSH
jgi:serine/threonine protein kinase